ncbi:helix-turn-helix domain-containing protein [Bifidobacterium breve]|nr:helix-turn-helix domain-containing protein [Bifidobacterium breve]MCZ4427268.1 helix-turn-helix domain-containing protein [Bifidobacterium breve]MCZ4454690.1 helix-turn-helix domain-containing protein [Bifidobacterium breve]MCZ4473821.1 helix-turn-helix domain-containing protein [Bifidobacterium breve]
MKAYSHLSAEERIRIDELRNREGLGVRQIALRISHGKPTVSREPRPARGSRPTRTSPTAPTGRNG